MNNQEILDNAPDGATHFSNDNLYLKFCRNRDKYWWSLWLPDMDVWVDNVAVANEISSLLSIKRIVELERELNTADSIIIKTADKIIEMDNCEQDSDEMNECWTVIKEFALIATGRCDT
jgi:hypothetical protein